MENLSEGEKKALAFCYFLADLETNISNPSNLIHKEIIIFVDDPFDSNDHYKYSNLPNVKFQFNSEKNIKGLNGFRKKVNDKYNDKSVKLIISTHNLGVYTSFFINITAATNKKDLCFAEIIPKFKKEILLLELQKDDENNAKFIELKHELFFPLETYLAEKLIKIFEKIINMQDIDLNKMNIIRVISLMLIKFYDKSDSEERDFYKNFIYGNWIYNNEKHPAKSVDELKNELKNRKIEYNPLFIKLLNKNNNLANSKIEKISFINIINEDDNFLDDLWDSSEDKDFIIFNEYFDKFSTKVNSILTKKNESEYEEIFKRLRHKNNILLNAIGFAIEE